MSNWIPLVTAAVGAAVAAAGFLLTGWHKNRESLDKRVERAVKGQVGDRFMDFLDVGERTTKEISDLTHSAKAQSEEMIADAQMRLDQLREGQVLLNRLDELLQRAEQVVPNLDAISEAAPAALLRDLDTPNADPAKVVAILTRIEESPTASSKQLEIAGDRAKDLLEDVQRARSLYERAVERNPANLSAKAEILAIDMQSGPVGQTTAAREELKDLIRAHPSARVAIALLFNDYIENDEYSEMEAFIRELLAKIPDDPLLWRNLAIALSRSSSDTDEVKAAYERSMASARAAQGDGDLVNTSKVYVTWLARQERYDDAARVLDEALRAAPDEVELYSAAFRLEMARGDRAKAARAAELMERLGGRGAAAVGRRMRSGLNSLTYLETGDASVLHPTERIDPAVLGALLQAMEGVQEGVSLSDPGEEEAPLPA